MRTREAALQALFALISGTYAWKNTPKRRLVMWNEVPAEQKPAFFQFEGGDDVYKQTVGPLPARTIEAKLFIYLDSSDHSVATSPTLSVIKDAVDGALFPIGRDTQLGKQTLGGTCDWCRIGNVFSDPGDIDGQGLIVIPIKITLP